MALPHDYKFPFAVMYKDGGKMEMMLLWAQSEENRKDWVQAFRYIEVK